MTKVKQIIEKEEKINSTETKVKHILEKIIEN